MKITILGEPLAKQSFRFTKKGHKYQNKNVVNWAAQARLQVINQLPKKFLPFNGPIVIQNLTFVFSLLKNMPKKTIKDIENGLDVFKVTKPDLLDNLQKNLWDVCEGVLFINDSRIVMHSGKMKKIYGKKPRIEFEIFSLED